MLAKTHFIISSGGCNFIYLMKLEIGLINKEICEALEMESTLVSPEKLDNFIYELLIKSKLDPEEASIIKDGSSVT